MKTYVVTGSTSGIGKAVVEELEKDAKNIIFAGYRDIDKVPHNYPQNTIYFNIDLSNSDSIKNAANFIKSKTNHIDTLINVAGIVYAGPVEYLDINKLKNQFNINTFSHLEFSQYLLGIIQSGKIINISSMSSFGYFPFISPYCASKRALDILFNSFAIENHKNIKIISVKPGVISTPIWEKSVASNLKNLENCNDYKLELEYIKNNALKNTTKGLSVKKVIDLIMKIDKMKNPKASYTVGKDAKFAQLLSFLPQEFINFLVKSGLKYRIRH